MAFLTGGGCMQQPKSICDPSDTRDGQACYMYAKLDTPLPEDSFPSACVGATPAAPGPSPNTTTPGPSPSTSPAVAVAVDALAAVANNVSGIIANNVSGINMTDECKAACPGAEAMVKAMAGSQERRLDAHGESSDAEMMKRMCNHMDALKCIAKTKECPDALKQDEEGMGSMECMCACPKLMGMMATGDDKGMPGRTQTG